ncbi:hypothetical protein, partial [uncultured Akkermansia sp.]|uniref:hypothetical protein n=1 Tax=uncultured Akkermansia sp. TaxID=512294 RepID=UPI00261CCD6D
VKLAAQIPFAHTGRQAGRGFGRLPHKRFAKQNTKEGTLFLCLLRNFPFSLKACFRETSRPNFHAQKVGKIEKKASQKPSICGIIRGSTSRLFPSWKGAAHYVRKKTGQ